MSLSDLATTPLLLCIVFAVTFVAGLVKGMVGFAMPMIIISGVSTILPPQTALAALILPTLASNTTQAFRQGFRAAWHSVKRFRLFLITGFITLLLSAQLVTLLPQAILFLVIGAPITIFALLQLLGWAPHAPGKPGVVEVGVGSFAGFIGGLSGVWGPPTVAYLTAIQTPKDESVRVQGVIYGLGAVALTAAHLQSGILNRDNASLSAILVIPGMIGLFLGFRLQDRIDQTQFRKITLCVLFVAGANLIRRGLTG